MKTLLEFCLRFRIVVFAMVGLVVAFGIQSARELPIDAVPDITNTQVQVLTNVPALGPVDVERSVTFPVESAMSGLPGVKQIRSVSRFGMSAVTIVFEDGTDLLRARQLVSERLNQARERLPQGTSPELGPMSSGLGEVFQFEVRADNLCKDQVSLSSPGCYSLMDLRSILDWFIGYELRSVPGVVEVNAFGGELKTYEVEVLPDRLRALNISLNQLFQAIEQNNATAGGGYLVRAGEQMLVRGEGRIQSLQEISEVLIETREGGVPVRVQDVARVQLAPLLRQGAVSRDARGEVVTGIVMMLVGANGRQVVDDVKAKLELIVPSLPEGVHIEPFYDRAELVNRTIRTVATNLAEGALLVVGILFLLLGSIRGGLIVAAAIPFSMLVAFIAMKALGVSGNLMSLGAIDFGIVVDGAIIVTESAVVHLAVATSARKRVLSYSEAAEVVLRSTLDIRKAALFGEAIIVIVYVPILALAGIEGKMFRPMAITVLFALFGAFVASLTFVPVLIASFLRTQTEHKEPKVVRFLHRVYRPLLARWMKMPKLLAGLVLLLAGLSVLVGSRLGAEFVPRLEEGALVIEMRLLPSASLEQSMLRARAVEHALLEHPEVTSAVSKAGRPEIATDPMGINQLDVFVRLKPDLTPEARSRLLDHLSTQLADAFPDCSFGFSQPVEMRMSEINGGIRSDVAAIIYGDDLGELGRLSQEVQGVLRAIDGASDVRGEQLVGLPMLEVTVDRAVASRYGVSVRDALDAIEALGGKKVGDVYEAERRFVLQVRLPRDLRDDIDQVRNVPVSGQAGPLVPLGQIANIQIVDSPASVSRDAVRRRTNVEVNVRDRDLASFVREAESRVRTEIELPPGYIVQWGGEFQNLREASVRLALAVPVALILIFILLYLAFGELKPALLIYLNVPFASAGGVLLLAIRGMPFSISAGIGFIALFGIAVLNGVVLLTTIQALRAQGKTPLEAAREGAESRLRAVVMTGIVAALGFLPMALSSSAGAEVQRPLATVVIGGLVTATFLTLFVLPSLYAYLNRHEGSLRQAE